jgi:hypothetical protein
MFEKRANIPGASMTAKQLKAEAIRRMQNAQNTS